MGYYRVEDAAAHVVKVEGEAGGGVKVAPASGDVVGAAAAGFVEVEEVRVVGVPPVPCEAAGPYLLGFEDEVDGCPGAGEDV